jgi:hypothetical protein
MKQVEIERAYRVIGKLEHTAKDIEQNIVPRLQGLIQDWKSRVFWTEISSGIFLILVLAVLWFEKTGISVKGFGLGEPVKLGIFAGLIAFIGTFLHLNICKWSANKTIKKLQSEKEINEETREGLMRAFRKNTTTLRALFIWLFNKPVGWSNRTHKRITKILGSVNSSVQKLNNQFTNPSGKKTVQPPPPSKTKTK